MAENSMGTFIAALRKSNGMTQMDLAKKLNISNKTVSKWECGEGFPEIMMLPALAEIFDVTVDELLKGKRISQDNDNKETKPVETKKQFTYLLKKTTLKFKNYSYVSLALIILGLISLFSISYAFYRPLVGFGVMMIFVIAGIITQVITSNNLLSTYEESNVFKEKTKKSIDYLQLFYKKTALIFSSGVFTILLSLPLVFVQSQYEKSVITFSAYLSILPIVLIVFGIISGLGRYFILKNLSNKYFLLLSDENKKNLKKTNIKFGIIILVTIILTSLCHIVILTNIDNSKATKSFDSKETYEKYISDTEKYFEEKSNALEDENTIIRGDYNKDNQSQVVEEINDSNGSNEYFNIISEYERILETDEDNLKITYSTDYETLSQKRNTANQIFIGIYIIEAIILFGMLLVQKKKYLF